MITAEKVFIFTFNGFIFGLNGFHFVASVANGMHKMQRNIWKLLSDSEVNETAAVAFPVFP